MSPIDGLLYHSPSPPITMGVADAGMPSCRRIASACSSVSRSMNRNGMALRVAKSRMRCASGEKREPMILNPWKPSPSSRFRRMRNALTIVAPRSGSSSTARRSSSVLSCRTRPSVAARAVTSAPRPESMSTSPVNSPAWCTATVWGVPRECSTISISPSSTTKKQKSRSPSANRTSSTRTSRGCPRAVRAARSLAPRIGKATSLSLAMMVLS